jgi:hypothetical protein
MRMHMPHFHAPHFEITERTTRIVGAVIIIALVAMTIALILFASTMPMVGLPDAPPVLIPAM